MAKKYSWSRGGTTPNPATTKKPKPLPRDCEFCGERFTPRVRNYARFDTAACRAAQWNLDNPRMKKENSNG